MGIATGVTFRAVVAVLVRPSLWGTAIVQVFRLARRRWWARPPFLPVPDRDYLRFRLETQYGDPDHSIEPLDLLTYLRWCRATNVHRQ
jgi:hypothetical protein